MRSPSNLASLPGSPNKPENKRSTGFYAPELDGLRFIAVAAVMISHYSVTLNRHADWGAPGVRLFFVLSGFLITHVLFRARDRYEEGAQTRGSTLREFYIRRIFRLWPLYFASLAVAYAFHVDGTTSPFAWHALFATNHYVFNQQSWPQLLSHYWTLAVEQQFYLVWPFAMLLLPMRVLPGLLFVLLAAGPVARWLPVALGWSTPTYSVVLLPACLDFFALGSLVAWLWRNDRVGRVGTRPVLRIAIVAAAGWLLLGAGLKTAGRQPYYWPVYDALLQGIGFSLLLVYLLRFPDSALAQAARWRPLVYLGQISYGIYIWHNFAHRFGPSLLRHTTGKSYFATETVHVLYYTGFTIVIAAISYHAFESPARRLGQRLALSG